MAMPSLETPFISPHLIGRVQEMETLMRALQAARQGAGQSFLMSGEAGVGKSRLLAETRRRARDEGFLILQGSCFEPDLTFPYAPLIDALRSLFAPKPTLEIADLLDPLATELVKLLPELALILPNLESTSSLDPEAEKRRLFEALAQFLTGLTQQGSPEFRQVPLPPGNSKEFKETKPTSATVPLLIILEDIHWSDETSLDFLHFFARRYQPFRRCSLPAFAGRK